MPRFGPDGPEHASGVPVGPSESLRVAAGCSRAQACCQSGAWPGGKGRCRSGGASFELTRGSGGSWYRTQAPVTARGLLIGPQPRAAHCGPEAALPVPQSDTVHGGPAVAGAWVPAGAAHAMTGTLESRTRTTLGRYRLRSSSLPFLRTPSRDIRVLVERPIRSQGCGLESVYLRVLQPAHAAAATVGSATARARIRVDAAAQTSAPCRLL